MEPDQIDYDYLNQLAANIAAGAGRSIFPARVRARCLAAKYAERHTMPCWYDRFAEILLIDILEVYLKEH